MAIAPLSCIWFVFIVRWEEKRGSKVIHYKKGAAGRSESKMRRRGRRSKANAEEKKEKERKKKKRQVSLICRALERSDIAIQSSRISLMHQSKQ